MWLARQRPRAAAREFDRIPADFGEVAQLGERRVRNAEVEGSIPFFSTKSKRRPAGRLFHGGGSLDRQGAAITVSMRKRHGSESPVQLTHRWRRCYIAPSFAMH